MRRNFLLYGSERYVVAILRPIAAAARARGDGVAWYFGGPGAELLGADDTVLADRAAVRRWPSDAVLTCNDLVPYFAAGAKVQVFHGFDAGKPRHIRVRGLFDLYCTTGPADTAAFATLARRHRHFTVTQTGWPKLDPFFRALAALPPQAVRPRPRILYHSTFSPSWSAAERLHDTVAALSRTGRWDWTVTLHPKMNPATVAKYRALAGPHLVFSDADNILELFPDADVMVSDTSSALHEYLLTLRPVVTCRNLRPGPYLIDIATPAELEPAIERALAHPPELMAAIRAHAAAIHPDRDGRSGERVVLAVDQFLAQGGRNARRKPLNLLRKWRIGRRLAAWERSGRPRTKPAPATGGRR
ncbi:MAG: hypothetical protein KF790_02945 [Steroidobacteraceae bacterium]|nr:hypothetical protein [Steroidobacteraceae bacterium]MCW5572281.1 hypothetical protein [Steroidobacteraceae bacterium]